MYVGAAEHAIILDRHVDAYQGLGWSVDGLQVAYNRQDGLWIADLLARRTERVLAWTLRPVEYNGPIVWR